MRFPVAVSASIFSIALYFTLFWGFEGLRVLSSPLYGLEEAWRSQIVYWIARSAGLGPSALLHLAALAGLIKLAIAGICAVAIYERFRRRTAGKADHEILEFGLLLVVIASIVTVAPALWEHDAGLIRTNTMNLVLVSIAAALNALERLAMAKESANVAPGRLATAMAEAEPVTPGKPRLSWFSPWR